ncbi:MAG: hypothetical protein II309_02710 [Bacilli bacterium]|nr:hypothetical protein [Bacilli bacterium]
MKIINKDKFVKLLADDGYKITNADRTFFSDFIYLGKNDSQDNYEEVPRAIWKHFVEDKSTDFDILSEKIEELQSSILQIEEISLQTDFKLLLLNLRSEDLERQVSPISSKGNLNMVNHTVIVDSKIYELLKKKITRNAYSTRESMQVMLDVYYFSERITETEYEELIELLV